MEIEIIEKDDQQWVKLSELKKLTPEQLEVFLFPVSKLQEKSENDDNTLMHCF